MTTLFFKLGDSIIKNWDPVVQEFQESYTSASEVFLRGFELCVTQVPFKIPYYALLTGLLNTRNHDLGADLLSTASKALNKALDDSEFTKVKLLVRYFGNCLNANVILPAQLIAVFDSFLGVITEQGVTVERSDAFVHCVMAALPWCASELRDRHLLELDRIFSILTEYMNSRSGLIEAAGIPLAYFTLAVYRDTSIDKPYIQKDQLDLLWLQIQDLKLNNWDASILANLFAPHKEALSEQLGHELSAINVPSSVTPVKFTYQPKFWIFNDAVNVMGEKTICHLPSTFSVSRFILDDMITDTIRFFSLNHTECTNLLLRTERYLNMEFVSKHKYQVYESVVESIVAEMMKFPKPSEKGVYYTTLIMDLCKESLDKIPSILGRVIKLLFNRLDGSDDACGMDVEGLKRFADFFAIHLSNFGFSWKWADWNSIISTNSNRTVFIREVLEKCIRLSYYERIKNSVPESFENQPKVFPSTAPSFSFRYESAQSTGDEGLFELVKNLNTKIALRDDSEAIKLQLESISAYAASNASLLDSLMTDHDYQPAVNIPQEALFQCVMFQGHKSFSHLLNVIEFYLPILQSWNEAEEARILTTKVIFSFWINNSQFLEIILAKLVNYRVIDSKSVLGVVLSASTLDNCFDRLFIWSIVTSTLQKVSLKAVQVSEKLEKVREDPDAASAMHDDNPDNVHELSQVLEAAQKEKKDMFLYTFQCFTNVLAEKIGTQGEEFLGTFYWHWVSGQFRQIGRDFQKEVDSMKFTIDAIVFAPITLEPILQIWQGMQKVYDVQE